MRLRFTLIVLLVQLLVSFAIRAAGSDALLQETILTAKKGIAAGKNAEAIEELKLAIPRANAMTDVAEKNAALAAIHFYSALAFSHSGKEQNAKQELEAFFRFSPSAAKLDPAKFDAKFLALFEKVQKSINRRLSVFDSLYPGFDPRGEANLSVEDAGRWETSAEFNLLGNDEEHAAYSNLKTPEQRTAFVEDFWKKHSPESSDAVEYRETVRRRIVFADAMFSSSFLRGAVTDRGRVFVLLGPPANVHVAAMSRATGATIPRRSAQGIDGQTETWVYFRPQLPRSIPTGQVNFVFLTQDGYGDHVMQKELFPLKVLEEAKKRLPERY
jgi:GWxTD domain-containing protein